MGLLLLHTGGTLMMQRATQEGALRPDWYTSDLLVELPVLKSIAEITARVLYNLDSSDMQPEHWVELASRIDADMDNYDGFVIVHGTDTMAYTASALAFLLQGLDKP